MPLELDTSVVVFAARDERACAEVGLVLAARGIEHQWGWAGRACELRVRAADAERAAAEIALYRAENWPRPAGRRQIPEIEGGWNGVVVYAALLMLIAVAVSQQLFGFDWLAAGRLEAGRVTSGEWWRAVTALTLHLELGHLAGNVAFGAFFGLAAARYLGPGVAWAAILGAGMLGNLLNALLQSAAHRSIGASTAVFGALGLLASYTWRRGFLQHTPWKERIAPVIAAIALLAFTGAGGENTDVLAHLTGFLSGFGIGLVLARIDVPTDARAQTLWGTAALAAVTLSWLLALGSAG